MYTNGICITFCFQNMSCFPANYVPYDSFMLKASNTVRHLGQDPRTGFEIFIQIICAWVPLQQQLTGSPGGPPISLPDCLLRCSLIRSWTPQTYGYMQMKPFRHNGIRSGRAGAGMQRACGPHRAALLVQEKHFLSTWSWRCPTWPDRLISVAVQGALDPCNLRSWVPLAAISRSGNNRAADGAYTTHRRIARNRHGLVSAIQLVQRARHWSWGRSTDGYTISPIQQNHLDEVSVWI